MMGLQERPALQDAGTWFRAPFLLEPPLISYHLGHIVQVVMHIKNEGRRLRYIETAAPIPLVC
ncbi:hypothetical protein A3E65_01050 [Candidatus Kaiserbacteria bacterium RIFCSPHIGHO2_12_FULL_56_13]|uniref:Uncharacterized protein n=2 Tax=Candidatus Kaiseribacteriota TaxID=1752734 RepID=A0A1F6E4R1_9BACT|nr:MAG: hypothetical protein A3C95_00320 [Candidatus Kaiserbacteria bacterium RIFCSPHIGHO2_02_FULL_56_30]OGG71709.1 MAG: hypothetical protein A3E65_01050 [Candidatus Kaiserbacteria bacterium RIFCSPHIGHO2_12_FULL_56_13]